MTEIVVRNVNDGLAEGLRHLHHCGVVEPSRNGPVLVSPGPVMTTYKMPMERALFSPKRNANPFFHVFEALWMLAGRNDLAWPVQFNKNFAGFSDDGLDCWGAYGWRWRKFFGYDQLAAVALDLRENPASRRAVLTMWNAWSVNSAYALGGDWADLRVAAAGGKDVPCNTHVYFDRRGEGQKLNMTVMCRSNDIIWGAYGANAVHFGFLLEYMAALVGTEPGVYRQFSNNFHMYLELCPQIVTKDTILNLALDAETSQSYPYLSHHELIGASVEEFDKELEWFLGHPMDASVVYSNKFLNNVAAPMYIAWHEWKAKRYGQAAHAINHIEADDWRVACGQWLNRRLEAKNVRPD